MRHLQVGDFRSWEHADLALTEGPTVLVGPNGQGKTNLIEAIGYVATLGSHRVATDGPLIRRGCSHAVVRAAVVNEGRELTVELELAGGKANRAKINRGPVPRPREVLGILRTVLFAPEDLSLVRGEPAGRRHFLDELLVSRTPRYAAVRSDYERVLRQRSALLKTAGGAKRSGRRVELGTLEVWDGHLARYGAELLAGRLRLVAELAQHVRTAYEGVAPRSEPADIAYRSSLGDALPADSAETTDTGALETALLAELERVRDKELDRGVSLVGPHRDDLELLLGDAPAKGYASHGESWSLALALRLGAFGLSRADGVEPVLILDDVFAELDRRRRARLAEVASTAQQVLVTAAVEEDVPEQLRGARYDITDGEIHAR